MSVSYEDVLIDLGIPPHLKGFRALEALCILREQLPEAKFCADLLVRAGKLLGCGADRVERNCRTAITCALDAGNGEHMSLMLKQRPHIATGGYELRRFVELCVLAKNRYNE